MRHRRIGMLLGLLGTVVGAMVMLAGSVLATYPPFNPRDLTVRVLGRATLDRFFLLQRNFLVTARDENDVVTAELTLTGKGSHTGWHTHPGPTFATVHKGTIDLIIVNRDGSCTTSTFHGDPLTAGDPAAAVAGGFVEGANILHAAQNVGEGDAVLHVTFLNITPRRLLPGAIINWFAEPRGDDCPKLLPPRP